MDERARDTRFWSPERGSVGCCEPGLLTHLDAVYGFALALTGDAELAADLTEDVFASTHDELWTTLGGHGLRDRLLVVRGWMSGREIHGIGLRKAVLSAAANPADRFAEFARRRNARAMHDTHRRDVVPDVIP